MAIGAWGQVLFVSPRWDARLAKAGGVWASARYLTAHNRRPTRFRQCLPDFPDFDATNRRSRVDQWDVLLSMIGTVGEPCLIKEEPDFAIKNIGLFKSKGEVEGK